MTLTAREAMQALLDGKGVISDQDRLYWLTEEDLLVFRGVHGYVEFDLSEMNQIVSIYEESPDYPLTFEEALKAMLDGKIVMNTASEFKTRFSQATSRFEILDHLDRWVPDAITVDEMKSLWKVVE